MPVAVGRSESLRVVAQLDRLDARRREPRPAQLAAHRTGLVAVRQSGLHSSGASLVRRRSSAPQVLFFFVALIFCLFAPVLNS